MATKAELLAQAKEQGLDVNTSISKKELENKLNQGSPQDERVDEVTVNENQDGEATNDTTKEGDEKSVENTESIPQNGVTKIEVLEVTDNEVAKKSDAARTKIEIQFADESNPNQKARNEGDQEYDQDGNLRTGGKSYGVSADDADGTVFDKQNEGEAPKKNDEPFTGRVMNQPQNEFNYLNPVSGQDSDEQNNEWEVKDQFKLEEELSDPKKGIAARVSTSAGNYVRVKFFWNNKPLGTYKSRAYSKKDLKDFLKRLMDERDI